jgi:SAM-dependent methyltransferase
MTAKLLHFPVADGREALERSIARWRDWVGAPGWAHFVWPELVGTLRLLRAQLPPTEWLAVRRWLRGTEIAALALEDPLTLGAWDRQRHLPADPVLFDLMFGHASQKPVLARATRLGREVHAAVYAAATPAAARERLRGFRAAIQQATCANPQAAVLSIGAGHLRVAESLTQATRPARWVALEPDARALPTLATHAGVEAVMGGFSRFVSRPASLGRFDLICIPTMYDALDDVGATRLTRAAFAALKPGGKLVFASFSRELPDAAYLDAFMDWRTQWRGPGALDAVLGAVSDRDVAQKRVYGRGRALGSFAMLQKPASAARTLASAA